MTDASIRNAALEDAAQIADQWAEQNRVAAAKAFKRGCARYDLDGDETQLVMSAELDGAHRECLAIACAIRELKT